MQLNSVKTRNIWFSFSGLLVAASIVLMIFSAIKIGTPIRLGLDFTGGTKLEYRFLTTCIANKAKDYNFHHYPSQCFLL